MKDTKAILIFDDDPDILELCEYILEMKGYVVYTRERCLDVIQDIEEVVPDLILMDNWIPDIGGVEATKTIKRHPTYKNIPVIYFSANRDVKNLSEQAGADAFIAKPFDLTEFEHVIMRTLGASTKDL